VTALALWLVAAAAASASPAVSVHVDRAAVATGIGKRFTFDSVVKNGAPQPARGLVAHLNVLSLREGTYVDPEDWSSHRTQYLPPLPSGRSLRLHWRVQAVNSGRFAVYVAVLPRAGNPRRPVTGPAIRVTVADRQSLNSGGVLPVVLGVPGLLAALALAIRARRAAA
jgi:hypothetical protein